MSSDLKPCPNPWCASHRKCDAEIFEAHRPILMPSRGSNEWAVACPVCPLQSPWFDTEAEATAAWNTRITEIEHLTARKVVGPSREDIALAICNEQRRFFKLPAFERLADMEPHHYRDQLRYADAIIALLETKAVEAVSAKEGRKP